MDLYLVITVSVGAFLILFGVLIVAGVAIRSHRISKKNQNNTVSKLQFNMKNTMSRKSRAPSTSCQDVDVDLEVDGQHQTTRIPAPKV